MLKSLTLTAALCACAGTAMAEKLYVTDSLRLGLYRTEDTSDKPFVNLVSGMELDVLERDREAGLAHVRTPSGEDGWVKASFLVADKPAQLRVAELEAQLAGLRSEAAESRGARAADEAPAAKAAVASKETNDAMHEALGRLKRENEAYEARLESYRGSLPLSWVAVALVVALVGGFAGGLWWLDTLIRRRHGGFRIY